MRTSRRGLDVAAILALGLGSRLLALPFSQVMDADATWRVWNAWRWLDAPHWISHDVWGPLSYYLNALALAAWPDPVLSPVLLHMAAAVGLALAVYAFTAQEFGEEGALPTALAALAWPLGFRAGLMPLPEIFAGLFVVLAMLAVGRLRRGLEDERKDWIWAILGGACLGLAGLLRFETWLLIPLFGGMLWRRPRLMAAFASVAAALPVAWMISCHASTGDALYSIHATRQITALGGGGGAGQGGGALVALAFYPMTWALGLTPPLALACLAGMGVTIARRRDQRAWLAAPALLLTLLVVEALRGDVTLKGRYVFLSSALSLPFLGALVQAGPVRRLAPGARRLAIGATLIACLPLGYAGHFFGGQWGPYYWKNIEPVPRVATATRALSRALNARLAPDDGVVLDFVDWQTTDYLGLATRLRPERVLIVSGMPGRPVPWAELTVFLKARPHGLLLLARPGRLLEGAGRQGSMLTLPGGGRLQLEPIFDVPRDPRATLWRYRLAAGARGALR
jgi:4-amino-4-deoxy-L-arabinose transferase-like glycosyltransferase